jgi:hypothetical protein
MEFKTKCASSGARFGIAQGVTKTQKQVQENNFLLPRPTRLQRIHCAARPAVNEPVVGCNSIVLLLLF